MKATMSGILFISTVLFIGFMLPVETPAAEFTCTIKAGRQDVYVIVTDYDLDGNRLRRGGERFQGVIKKGQRQSIKSLFGKIRYKYRLYNQSRSSGRNSAHCESGKIIQLP
jgi:actin-like ATPase involved in cell morphogenesis